MSLLYEWGANYTGQLGNGETNDFNDINDVPTLLKGKPPLPKGLNINDIQAVSCGNDHTALLTKSGYIYCTGDNQSGQLGIPNTTFPQVDKFTKCQGIDEIQGKIKAISCGGRHTAILTNHGYIYCTGSNIDGQLGIDIIIPNVDKFTLCTDFDNKQGKIKAISCGVRHTALLTKSGYIYCTGNNLRGQLGIPLSQTFHLLPKVDHRQDPYYLDKFTICNGGKDIDNIQGKIKAISCGLFHTALLTKSGYIYATGQNNSGQLGIPKNQTNPPPKKPPLYYLDEFTICKGIDNIQGYIKAISCGLFHTALLTIYGYIYCTGDNSAGQLGIETYSNVDIFTKCKGGKDIKKIQGHIKAISCGVGHTLILTKDGQIYATGWNKYGQLGIPITTFPDVNTFTAIVPNALPKNVNNKFSWISDGCSANSVFAYKDIIYCNNKSDKSIKIWCNLDFSC
jgi:alpha-tubulin suppressor-like RCC1 family protein